MGQDSTEGIQWDAVWEEDRYSTPQLRLRKARYKTELFESMGVDFADFDRILDLGCGGGYIACNIASKWNCKILAVDISESAIRIAKTKNRNERINYQLGDARYTDLSGHRFDAVLLIGVLEHIDDASRVLRRVGELLKENGKLLISSSNRYSIFFLQYQLYQLLGLWKYGYTKHYSRMEIQNLLKRHSFSIRDMRIVGCNGG